MGLDITAYRKLWPAPQAEVDSDGYPKEYDKFAHFGSATIQWTEEHWPGHSDGIKPGVYGFAEAHGFRAGSYGGYNQWRNQLSCVMRGKPAEDLWKEPIAGPFAELIHFADNEGVIGPTVAAKLAKDFADNQARAEAVTDEYFLKKYNEWRKAFELAADDGAVDFH
jgi:hypothetical protein